MHPFVAEERSQCFRDPPCLPAIRCRNEGRTVRVATDVINAAIDESNATSDRLAVRIVSTVMRNATSPACLHIRRQSLSHLHKATLYHMVQHKISVQTIMRA